MKEFMYERYLEKGSCSPRKRSSVRTQTWKCGRGLKELQGNPFRPQEPAGLVQRGSGSDISPRFKKVSCSGWRDDGSCRGAERGDVKVRAVGHTAGLIRSETYSAASLLPRHHAVPSHPSPLFWRSHEELLLPSQWNHPFLKVNLQKFLCVLISWHEHFDYDNQPLQTYHTHVYYNVIIQKTHSWRKNIQGKKMDGVLTDDFIEKTSEELLLLLQTFLLRSEERHQPRNVWLKRSLLSVWRHQGAELNRSEKALQSRRGKGEAEL